MKRRMGMEAVVGGTAPGYARAQQVLGRVEARLDPAYDVMKLGRMALGDAPISFASTAVSGLLRVSVGPGAAEHVNKSVTHAGLAADGLFRGLLYSGGLLHAVAAKHVPWLVVSRPPPAGFAGIASNLAKVAGAARVGLLGVGGALGALRAAKAVAEAGTPAALLTTKDGRSGAAQALGSALLMVRHPATYLAGAGLFGFAMVNEFL